MFSLPSLISLSVYSSNTRIVISFLFLWWLGCMRSNIDEKLKKLYNLLMCLIRRRRSKSLTEYFNSHVPAKHHNGGLRISPRRVVKGGTIDNAKGINTENLVVPVDDFPNLATSVVVPNGHHSVSAELFEREGGIGVFGQQVNGGTRGHVEKHGEWHVGVSEGSECLGFNYLLHRAKPLHAPLQVSGVLEVVEGHWRVLVWIAASELQMPAWNRTHYLLQDEPSPEGCLVQTLHLFYCLSKGLWGPLLWGHPRKLTNLHWNKLFYMQFLQ